MMLTPASEVPQTPVGRFYLAIPDAVNRVAVAYAAQLGFDAENFFQELMQFFRVMSYEELEGYVAAYGMQSMLDEIKKGLPLAILNDPMFDFRTGRRRSCGAVGQTMMRTPASEVPQTPLGCFYLMIPDAVNRVAAAYAVKLGFNKENFFQELMQHYKVKSYQEIENFVAAHSMQTLLDEIKTGLPLAILKQTLFDFRTGRRWTNRQMTTEEIEERCPPEPIVEPYVFDGVLP